MKAYAIYFPKDISLSEIKFKYYFAKFKDFLLIKLVLFKDSIKYYKIGYA